MSAGRALAIAMPSALAIWFAIFLAASWLSQSASPCPVQMPPANYRASSIPKCKEHPTKVVLACEYQVDAAELRARCAAGHDPSLTYLGCALGIAKQHWARAGTRWMIFLPKHAMYGCSLSELRRHELAHANGWVHR